MVAKHAAYNPDDVAYQPAMASLSAHHDMDGVVRSEMVVPAGQAVHPALYTGTAKRSSGALRVLGSVLFVLLVGAASAFGSMVAATPGTVDGALAAAGLPWRLQTEPTGRAYEFAPLPEEAARAQALMRGGVAPGAAAEAAAAAAEGAQAAGEGTAEGDAALPAFGTSENPLPKVATCADVDIYSMIMPSELSAVLLHQASYDYAYEFFTPLPEANIEEVEETRTPRVNREQTSGEWLDADALHLWRTADATAMDTSIDMGAFAGTTVYAPVSGTVVLVVDYMLFDETPDIEIHIQPTGRPDLDCVVLHTYDPLVAAGDTVVGGVTPISHVRDIASHLTDIQLYYYTPEDDPGNHAHVQVNNADAEGYRERKLPGALEL